jgi:hypothetical protein
MAPIPKESSDTILALSNHDFFKNGQCPMRTGNVRCRNISMCTRVHYGDQLAPEKAEKLRGQLIQHVKSLAAARSPPSSLVWNNIETKVVMLMDWVVCQKHLAQRETAVCMTIGFLKQDCGIFVEDEGVQAHAGVPAASTPLPPHMSSKGPYASATTYLATPPPTPAAYFPSQAWQYAQQYPSTVQATVPIKREPTSGPVFGQPQQSAFNFTVNKPLKSEPVTSYFAPQVQQLFHASPTPNASQRNTMSNASSTQPQQVPFGFGVRAPTNNEHAINTPSSKQPRARATEPQPPAGPAIRPSVIKQDRKSQPTKQQAPFGFEVRPRTDEGQVTTQQPAQSNPVKEKVPCFCDKCNVLQARLDASDKTTRAQMDQLAKNNKVVELSHKKAVDENRRLADETERLGEDNMKLKEDNKRLADEKKRLQARADTAVNAIGELEDENESLTSKLATSEEVVERLEKELAALKKPLLSRLGVW